MKKSSIITITILLVLAIASILIYKSKGKTTTLDTDASNFKYTDTAAIDKIFLADKDGKQVLIERKKEGWIVDGKYLARPDLLQTLLYTISAVEVKSPISKKSAISIIKIMAAKSTKIEVYSKGKKVKQYFIGHPTQDHEGTYMLLTDLESGKNYEVPFITYIRGFTGFLSTRYNTLSIDWRDRLLLNYRPPQIKQIKLDLHDLNDSSFVIDLYSMQRFGLKTAKGKTIVFDEDKIKQYITYFQNVNCEVVMDKKDHLVDSLSKSALPFATLTITDRNNETNVCEFFHKQPNFSKNEQYGVEYKYDPDRLFVRYNKGADYGVAQFFVFGKILQTYEYFLPRK